MLNRLIQYTQKTNGTFSFFNQVVYMQKNRWVANNPRNLGGAWIGGYRAPETNLVQYGLRGACYGLSAAYLIAGKDWSNFKNFLNTTASHRLILGIMNIQEQNCSLNDKKSKLKMKNIWADKLNRKKCHPDRNYLTTEEAYHLIMKNEGNLNILITSTLPQSNSTLARIEGLTRSLRPNTLYEIDIYQDYQEGHSIAIRTDKGMIKFFDPNIGEISYSYNKSQIIHFIEALCIVFNEFYKNYNRIKVNEYYR